ncbi:MAG TPA: cyclic nucleotide-binding domain-containing protein [Anaerolineales bacterium]|nr:cyclic nucleotide-binding domain-containing protein [Anaerolineales bacterium]
MISIETLRKYSLFDQQDETMLTRIANLAEERVVEAGGTLFSQGDPAKYLYLVIEGSVVLTMNVGRKGAQTLEELEPLGKDRVVGWSSMVKPHIYKMGAYAKQRSRVIAFEGNRLHQLFDENPSFGYYFLQRLTEVIGSRLIGKCVQLMSLIDW